ncbi:MAG: cytochrome-c peroxidase [Opitutaceae bacterium]|nr:cytochrome-c peroxidase [Opitutaceae bacterium]
MKTHILFFAVVTSFSHAQDGVIDLTQLHNYANQSRPAYIANRDNTPVNNPITDAGATLGRVMFYDKRMSRNDTISCSSCHQQARGFSDTAIASTGVAGTTGRHSMRLINSRFGNEAKFFWDERAASLEAQTTQPVRDHVEMGFSGASGDPAFAELVNKLNAIPEYRVLFAMTYGSATINETNIQKALAQFVRSIQSFDSKYDAGRAVAADNQPFPNFTTSENNGKALFINPPGAGGAGCAGCHVPPHFDIDPNSANNGVIGSLAGGIDLTNVRSPTLRDLVGPGGSSNGPFMHNGAFTTLNQVVAHYNAVPNNPANTNLDNRLRRPGNQTQNLNLTTQQQSDLAAFMRTLTGTAVYTDVKWSNPFDANGELDVIILPGSVESSLGAQNATFQMSCKVAPGLTYTVEKSTDLQVWTAIGTATPDAQGNITFATNIAPPQAFYRFKYTP